MQLKLKGNFFKQIDGVKFVGTCELLSGNKHLQKDRGDILFGNEVFPAHYLSNQPKSRRADT